MRLAFPASMECSALHHLTAALCSLCGVVQHGAFYQNEEVADKLKILDYETNFCEPNDLVPFPKTYFAMTSGQYVPCSAVRWAASVGLMMRGACSGQFDNFLDLVKYLFRESNREFTTDKFDDPNTRCDSGVQFNPIQSNHQRAHLCSRCWVWYPA